MSDRLITVATYTEPTMAHLAQQKLEAAGVRCVLADDNTTGMDWLLGNAIGWVKLQVIEADADRAVAVLEGVGPAQEPPSTAITEAGPGGGPPPRSDDEESSENERSKMADRAFRAALLGLLLCPLELYAAVLLWEVWHGSEPLSDLGRRRALWASLINVPYMASLMLGVLLYLAGALDLW
jgi:hypothetical protein